MKTLGRHDLDRIARAVVSGERGLSAQHDRLADAVARRVRSKLEAVGAAGAARARAIGTTPGELRREEVTALPALLARVDKHVAWVAMKAIHGGAQPR
jgi:hypothetical protein